LIPKGEKHGIKAIMGEKLWSSKVWGTRNPTNKPNTKFKILGETKGRPWT
jgi:hypothetical protein